MDTILCIALHRWTGRRVKLLDQNHPRYAQPCRSRFVFATMPAKQWRRPGHKHNRFMLCAMCASKQRAQES